MRWAGSVLIYTRRNVIHPVGESQSIHFPSNPHFSVYRTAIILTGWILREHLRAGEVKGKKRCKEEEASNSRSSQPKYKCKYQ
jgi:hypothetical protein